MVSLLAFSVLLIAGAGEAPDFSIEVDGSAEAPGVFYSSLDGFLCQGEGEGIVRPGRSFAYVGPYSMFVSLTETRLAREIAERLHPFVFDSVKLRGHIGPTYDFHFAHRGANKDRAFPRFMLRMLVRQRCVAGTPKSVFGRIEEISAARLLSAERLSDRWMAAWQRLDGVVWELVFASLKAPSPEKRVRLAELIEEGVAALTIMETPEEDEGFLSMLREIEPRAQVVPLFRARANSEWREVFIRCIERLGVQPQTALPEHLMAPEKLEPLGYDKIPGEWLLEVSSPKELIERAVRKWGSDALYRRLPWQEMQLCAPDDPPDQPMPGIVDVYLFMLQDCSAQDFAHHVQRARNHCESLERLEQVRYDPESGKAHVLERLGVVVKALDDDWLAANLFLRGCVATEVLPEGEAKGFRKGDCLFFYDSPLDESGGPFRLGRSLESVHVLRDGTMMVVECAEEWRACGRDG